MRACFCVCPHSCPPPPHTHIYPVWKVKCLLHLARNCWWLTDQGILLWAKGKLGKVTQSREKREVISCWEQTQLMGLSPQPSQACPSYSSTLSKSAAHKHIPQGQSQISTTHTHTHTQHTHTHTQRHSQCDDNSTNWEWIVKRRKGNIYSKTKADFQSHIHTVLARQNVYQVRAYIQWHSIPLYIDQVSHRNRPRGKLPWPCKKTSKSPTRHRHSKNFTYKVQKRETAGSS